MSMTTTFISFITPILLVSFGSNDTIIEAILIQEKFTCGFYLESGVAIGDGNVFFKLRENPEESVFNPDTIYIFDGALGNGQCLSIENDVNCVIKHNDEKKGFDLSSRRLRRELNRSSFHPKPIHEMCYHITPCRFRICRIGKGTHAFINYNYRKRTDALLVLQEIVIVHITCP